MKCPIIINFLGLNIFLTTCCRAPLILLAQVTNTFHTTKISIVSFYRIVNTISKESSSSSFSCCRRSGT